MGGNGYHRACCCDGCICVWVYAESVNGVPLSVPITVAPSDCSHKTDGTTSFRRDWRPWTGVQLIAPQTFDYDIDGDASDETLHFKVWKLCTTDGALTWHYNRTLSFTMPEQPPGDDSGTVDADCDCYKDPQDNACCLTATAYYAEGCPIIDSGSAAGAVHDLSGYVWDGAPLFDLTPEGYIARNVALPGTVYSSYQESCYDTAYPPPISGKSCLALEYLPTAESYCESVPMFPCQTYDVAQSYPDATTCANCGCYWNDVYFPVAELYGKCCPTRASCCAWWKIYTSGSWSDNSDPEAYTLGDILVENRLRFTTTIHDVGNAALERYHVTLTEAISRLVPDGSDNCIQFQMCDCFMGATYWPDTWETMSGHWVGGASGSIKGYKLTGATLAALSGAESTALYEADFYSKDYGTTDAHIQAIQAWCNSRTGVGYGSVPLVPSPYGRTALPVYSWTLSGVEII